ncbi:S24 family peptidase [Brevundimonas variabilis]|uniref:Phage repressor protein C with HTH and peptisase S24 domain n=1 Tax=Brevundimonas variabilis TaxID=74312 RepID=A0A7W9CH39_9CAUL|nr:helix-turn-helix transcriptional regulator [Brevundimonas variabilis]MBB5745530.1 phage repressor protein C with HTH and peptisase S24 domain [Brevundimonas variabilis]
MPLSHANLWIAVDSLARREGLSASGLAIRAGLDPTAFNPSKRIGPGNPPRPRWPSTESLTRILRVTQTSLGEFAALAGDAADVRQTVPVIGMAQAGTEGYFDEAGLPTGDGWEAADLLPRRESLFGLRISGDSMTPLYREGDCVIVDRDAHNVRKGDRVVVQTRTGETIAKEIGRLTSQALTLVSINPAYEPRILARRDIAWMSRILWVSQ